MFIRTYKRAELAVSSFWSVSHRCPWSPVSASVADDVLKLDEKSENILADAFNVLVDNEKKISEAITKSKRGNTDDAEEIEELTEGNREAKKTHGGHAVATITEVMYPRTEIVNGCVECAQ